MYPYYLLTFEILKVSEIEIAIYKIWVQFNFDSIILNDIS
jgi:hypothetical protein